MLQKKTLDLINQIQSKIEGLYHYSDTVFPYSVSGIGEGNFSLYSIMNNVNEEFHEIEIESFFSGFIRSHSWMATEEKTRVKKYLELREFLLLNFESIKVIKTGSVQIEIHIIAKTFQKDYIIISTSELRIPIYQKNDA